MGLRKRRRNTIITSPQIYEDREIEIFVPRRAQRGNVRRSHAVQNIFNYGIIICCLRRGKARMHGCAASTDYINLISSSLTMLADYIDAASCVDIYMKVVLRKLEYFLLWMFIKSSVNVNVSRDTAHLKRDFNPSLLVFNLLHPW